MGIGGGGGDGLARLLGDGLLGGRGIDLLSFANFAKHLI